MFIVAVMAVAADPLILQLSFTQSECKGTAIPQTVAVSGICGLMTTTFSAIFSANATNVHVDIYNSTSCDAKVFESKDESVGACLNGNYQYQYPAERLASTCLLWGHTQPTCPDGQAMSATVAKTMGKCAATEGFSVDQTFAVAAGGGTYNITTFQYDSHFGDCYPMSFFPLIKEGSCLAFTGWYAPYAKLECSDSEHVERRTSVTSW